MFYVHRGHVRRPQCQQSITDQPSYTKQTAYWLDTTQWNAMKPRNKTHQSCSHLRNQFNLRLSGSTYKNKKKTSSLQCFRSSHTRSVCRSEDRSFIFGHSPRSCSLKVRLWRRWTSAVWFGARLQLNEQTAVCMRVSVKEMSPHHSHDAPWHPLLLWGPHIFLLLLPLQLAPLSLSLSFFLAHYLSFSFLLSNFPNWVSCVVSCRSPDFHLTGRHNEPDCITHRVIWQTWNGKKHFDHLKSPQRTSVKNHFYYTMHSAVLVRITYKNFFFCSPTVIFIIHGRHQLRRTRFQFRSCQCVLRRQTTSSLGRHI